jgi:hypothetical protein
MGNEGNGGKISPANDVSLSNPSGRQNAFQADQWVPIRGGGGRRMRKSLLVVVLSS